MKKIKNMIKEVLAGNVLMTPTGIIPLNMK